MKEIFGSKLRSAAITVASVALVGTIATTSAQTAQLQVGAADLSGYTKDQCKNGGWQDFKNADGSPMFKNQGDCVSFFASQGRSDARLASENAFFGGLFAALGDFFEQIFRLLSSFFGGLWI